MTHTMALGVSGTGSISAVMATILALRKTKDNCDLKNFKLDNVMKIDETFQPVLIANW